MMKAFPYLFLILFIISCQKPDNTEIKSQVSNGDPWLIPKDDVLNFNSEKDRIQSIDYPEFIPINESNLKPNDLVLVAHIGDETKIYPISILDAHEVVNDIIYDGYFSVTYCPLTGSGMLWNREIDGKVTEFGVSGMLYNRNLMPYDRNTESIWSQMETKCVNGSLIGIAPETKALLETKFSTIKMAFPEAIVLAQHDCDSNVCEISGFLKTDPIDGETVSLPADQEYFGFVKNESLLLFNFALFSEGTQLFRTNFQGSSLLVCGNNSLHYFTAFLNNGSSRNYTFSVVQNAFPIIMEDDHGNKYNVFGEVTEGPGKGSSLETATAYNARTFAWELFFNEIELFTNVTSN
jgi:hypothetical protein